MSGEIFTVSQLNDYIGSVLASDPYLSNIWVKGEISNFKYHSSGHMYFSIKDEDSLLKVVMFKSNVFRLSFVPENGMKVLVFGSVSVYQRNGEYQLYAAGMEPDGIGALYLAYEQLKNRLEKEGYFDPIHKKPLPRYPRKVGIVTSPTGAAVQDMINVISRRFRCCEIIIYPSLVQGPDAPKELIKGIEYFSARDDIDEIIIGRGGGSIEDLWAFNNEDLAKAVFVSSHPVISAVGHETDFTICDFVSDVRAPTPSAAAELAVPDEREVLQKIRDTVSRQSLLLSGKINSLKERLLYLSESKFFKDPVSMLDCKKDCLRQLTERADSAFSDYLDEKRMEFEKTLISLDERSPLKIMSRGYAFVTDENGKNVRKHTDVKPGDRIRVRIPDSEIVSLVEKNTRVK